VRRSWHHAVVDFPIPQISGEGQSDTQTNYMSHCSFPRAPMMSLACRLLVRGTQTRAPHARGASLEVFRKLVSWKAEAAEQKEQKARRPHKRGAESVQCAEHFSTRFKWPGRVDTATVLPESHSVDFVTADCASQRAINSIARAFSHCHPSLSWPGEMDDNSVLSPLMVSHPADRTDSDNLPIFPDDDLDWDSRPLLSACQSEMQTIPLSHRSLRHSRTVFLVCQSPARSRFIPDRSFSRSQARIPRSCRNRITCTRLVV
jgi:hypothetical protein